MKRFFCVKNYVRTHHPFPDYCYRSFATIRTDAIQYNKVVDLRSDTVTAPTRPMLETALSAATGDDVMGEDPTVLNLQQDMADMFGKEAGLYVPTGTMANLVAILSHCNHRASEMLLGANSHISLWEGGNAATLGGIHTRQIVEHPEDATLDTKAVQDAFRLDDDDHYAKTSLLCLENTHNLMGGVAFSPQYMDKMGKLAHETFAIPLHVDGARIFHACIAHNASPADMCRGVDSISICLSKGLGAPMGSVLVGGTEFIRLAKRARKHCGGGLRQVGVVAAMGQYAVDNNIIRLKDDHERATKLAEELSRNGFSIQRRKDVVYTNIVYFSLPRNSKLKSEEELCHRLETEYNVKLSSGYTRGGGGGGSLFRAVTHMDIDDEGIDRAIDALVKLCCVE